MTEPGKQIYILCDMEGASQISPENKQALYHGSELWQEDGRRFVTSDVKAACEAANEFGIDEILINDEHDYGNREPNLLVSELPGNVRMVRRPHLPGALVKLFFRRRYQGRMESQEAFWQARTVVSGLYGLHMTRMFMERRATRQ